PCGAGTATLDQAEALELTRLVGADARPRAELAQFELGLGFAERHRAAPLPVGLGRRRQLLADHAERQELVALEAEHRAQPLDVVLAVQAVAALRAARR